MQEELGLADRSRVAVIGGGVAGSAVAAAILLTARSRGRQVEVCIYEGPRDAVADTRPPVVLTPDCRSRLATLGCRVPKDWRSVELLGVEVISGRNRSLLRGAPGGLWVVDAWPEGLSGRTRVAQGVSSVAALHGARIVSRTVDRLEIAGRKLENRAPQSGSGSVVVWASGASERFHSAVLATAAHAPIADRFGRLEPPPTLLAAHARLRYPPFVSGAWPVAKLILAPVRGVDGLYLLPCRSTVYALAFGSSASPADLCQALMIAARDRHLKEGFEIAHLDTTRVPAGVGKNLCAAGLLAVGGAALGHPLQLGLGEALATCTHAAVALVDGASAQQVLQRLYARDGMYDLAEQARAAVKSVRWLRRAGDRAALAVEEAQRRSAPGWNTGVLGLPTPSPITLVRRARLAAWAEALSSVWRLAVEPIPSAVPRLEPGLYYVVDDDAATRDSVSELLMSRGGQVVSFEDELALFSATALRPPAAILLDVVLSWVDGIRLCEELKRHPASRDVRVIVMSGLNRPDIRERALRAGAEAFIAKPFTPEDLLGVLDPWTRLPEPRRPRAAGRTALRARGETR